MSLLAGFYALALAVAVGLVGAAVGALLVGLPGRFWIAIACALSALVIARSLVPRRIPFLQPGPRLDPARHPELRALVREVADATQQGPPAEVYLAHDFNASVTEVGGIAVLPGCRVLILGLPLLDALTIDELRAVLAHEFGHYRGGDTRLARFFFRTYDGIERTIAALEGRGSLWRFVFVAYGRFFLRRTAALRRAQEFDADAVAAGIAGRDVMASALYAVAAGAGAFDSYVAREFAPAIDGGVQPPFREGFARFSSVGAVQTAIGRHVHAELEASTEPYDTHPSLGERLAALGVPAEPREPAAGRRAIELVRDADRLEEELVRHVLAERELPVRRADWDEVPRLVFVPAWRLTVAEHRADLAGVSAGSLPHALDGLSTEGGRLFEGTEAPPEEVRRQVAAGILGTGLALALYDAGWALDAPPGEPVRLAHGGHVLEPFALTGQLARRELDAVGWNGCVDKAEIASLPLGGGGTGEPRPAALAR